MRAWIVALVAAALAARAVADEVVQVTLNGVEESALLFSVEGDAPPREDDLVEVGQWLVPRGAEASPRFRVEPGKLWRIGDDGRERLVGALAAGPRPDGKPDEPSDDVLGKLSDAEIAGLQCVRVENRSAAVAAKLALVDAARTCFVVAGWPPDPSPLPDAARVVVFATGDSCQGLGSLEPLARLKSLRVLSIGRRYDEKADLAPLAGLTELRRLHLCAREVAHVEALSNLTKLRFLNAGYCDGLADVAFAKPLAALRVLDVSCTKVEDLSPFSDHAELREIRANETPVRVLPTGELPALRSLRLLSTKVPIEEADAFAKAHPACDVVRRRGALLVAAAAKVDRLRVRSGGTCHRDVDEEKSLLELTARADIDEFVRLFRVDEERPGFQCGCCGDPTIEFYEGARLVAELGFHHGHSLRWARGPWPGDTTLVRDAAEELCAWLARRGVTGPQDVLDREKRRIEEFRARDAEQTALLGKERRAQLRDAEDATSATKRFVEWFPERDARFALLLRLASPQARTESFSDRVADFAARALREDGDPAAVLAFLGGRIDGGGDEALRAADQIRRLSGGPRFDAAELEKLRLSAAKLLIAAKEPRDAVSILEDAKSPAADAMLVALLPPAGADGAPTAAVTALHVEIAFVLVDRCDAPLLPRLRAIIVLAPKSSGYGPNPVERFDRIVGKREAARDAK